MIFICINEKLVLILTRLNLRVMKQILKYNL